MHRFIPIYASWSGARVHGNSGRASRAHDGQLKYGSVAHHKVVFDLMTIKFYGVVSDKAALHVRLRRAGSTFVISFLCAVLALLMKFADWPHHADFVQTPLPVLTMVNAGARACSSSYGFAGRDVCAHLSRIAIQTDLCGPRADRI
jgi:dolichol-phosphate mannosyltransferase